MRWGWKVFGELLRLSRLLSMKFDQLRVYFAKDGAITKFLEGLPIIGFVVGGVHWFAGNTDHAARAIAASAGSTTVTVGMVIGTAIGSYFASPIIGCMVGAAIATPCGLYAEMFIAKRYIKDPQMRAQIQEVTIARCIAETLRNVLAGAASAVVASCLGKAMTPSIDMAMQTLVKLLARMGVRIALDISFDAILTKVLDLLEGREIKSWDIAMQALNKAKKNRPHHFG
ncbi:hypothetical protein MD484_g8355, partial [Candolleomyces efflorescens]